MSKEPCPIGYGPCRLHVSRAFLVPSPLHMRADILDAGVGLLLVNLVSTVLHGVLYRGKGSDRIHDMAGYLHKGWCGSRWSERRENQGHEVGVKSAMCAEAQGKFCLKSWGLKKTLLAVVYTEWLMSFHISMRESSLILVVHTALATPFSYKIPFHFCGASPRKPHNLALTQWDNVYQSGDLGGQLQMKVQITQVTRHDNEPNILYLPPRAPRPRESPKRKIHIVALG